MALIGLAACENVDFLHENGSTSGPLGGDSDPTTDLSFAQMPLPQVSAWVNVLWGFDANDVYAGVRHHLFHYDGVEWTDRILIPTNQEITALAGHSGQVFVGAWHEFYVYDGATLTPYATGSIYAITDMIAFAPDQVYFTVWITTPTPTGALYKFNGVQVTEVFARTDTDLNGLWGASPAELFLVGSRGKILRYAGGLVFDETVTWNLSWGALSDHHFTDIAGMGSERVAVGTNHMIFTRQAGVWTVSRPPGPADEELWSVAGWQTSGALAAYAAGARAGGTLLHLDGSWQPVSSLPSGVEFVATWSAGPGHLLVGGGYLASGDPYLALGSPP